MELLQLRYFKLVAEKENMSRAAEELNIVQPAVSRSIKRLEEELGTTLFERKGRQIILNEHGKVAYKKAVEALNIIDEMKTDVLMFPERISIHLSIEAASALIPSIISEYKSEKQNVEFIIDQKISSDQCDIRITSIESDVESPGEILFEESIKLLIPIRMIDESISAKLDTNTVELEDLKEKPFIGLTGVYRLRKLTDRFCDRIGFTPNYVFESDNPSMLRSMIDEEMGIVFFPDSTWGQYDKSKYRRMEFSGEKLVRKLVAQRFKSDSCINDFYEFMKVKLEELRHITSDFEF